MTTPHDNSTSHSPSNHPSPSAGAASGESADGPAFRPLSRHARRVLGVLVEKAKTTPDNYPMTVAAIVAGSNQKSNRAPQMQLDEDDVVLALDELRQAGAAREVQGSGRVNKYRHAAYEWLGVNGPQAAVMTELLLRGPQTSGELRARCSRMEPFADLAALTATLDELQGKGLVIPLSPPGRGQTFAHTLYQPDELAHLTSRARAATEASSDEAAASLESEPSGAARPGQATSPALETLVAEVRRLSERVERLERELGLAEEENG